MSKLVLLASIAGGGLLLTHAGLVPWGSAQGHIGGSRASGQIYIAKATAPATGLESQLKTISDHLKGLLGEGKRIAAKLGHEVDAHPGQADKLITDTEATLSRMADQTNSTGEAVKEIAAIRGKAIAYREAVMQMPSGAMSETDRQRVLDAWNRVIDTASKAQAAVDDIHTTLLAELQDLRRKAVAIRQLMLAGEYQAALDDVLTWTKTVRVALQRLNGLLTGGPTS